MHWSTDDGTSRAQTGKCGTVQKNNAWYCWKETPVAALSDRVTVQRGMVEYCTIVTVSIVLSRPGSGTIKDVGFLGERVVSCPHPPSSAPSAPSAHLLPIFSHNLLTFSIVACCQQQHQHIRSFSDACLLSHFAQSAFPVASVHSRTSPPAYILIQRLRRLRNILCDTTD